jgi:hypothetical protein
VPELLGPPLEVSLTKDSGIAIQQECEIADVIGVALNDGFLADAHR